MVNKVRNIWREFDQAGALNTLIPVFAFLDEQTFLTKSGDLGVMFQVHGIDYECLDPLQVDHVTRRFEAALRSLTEDYRLYQYLLKRNCPEIAHRTYKSQVVDKAIEGRMAFLSQRADTLYSLDLYFVLLYEGLRTQKRWRQTIDAVRRNPVSAIRERLSGSEAVALLDSELQRAQQTLRAKANGFLIQVQDFLRAELLEKHDVYRFLAHLTNYAPYRSDAMRLKFDAFLDQQLAASALECQRDHLRLQDHAIRILSVTEPPAQTFANMLHALMELPSNAIVVSEWKRADNFKIRKLIRSKRRHHHNSKTSLTNYLSDSQPSERSMLIDDSDEALVNQLGQSLKEMEIEGNYFGEWSMTVVLYDRERQRLDHAVAECVKVFSSHDATVIEERYNLLNAWLAVLPGNRRYNLRHLWLLNTNCADLSLIFTLDTGEPVNRHLGQEYLAVLETSHNTPYYLNLHYEDIAHTLILGATGSGKTTMLNALASFINEGDRIVLIEDTAEIQIDKPNLVRFEARREQPGIPAVTIRDLLRATLRHRPDRIILGEVRGGEAFDLLQALNTGHSGTLSTIHANSAMQALSRLTSCVLQSGVELPYQAVRASIADAIQWLLHLDRRHGRRAVGELLRVDRYDHQADQYLVTSLYRTPEAGS